MPQRKGNHYKHNEKFLENEAKALIEYSDIENDIPFLKHFCVIRGYGYQRIVEFCERSKVFAEAVERMKSIQEVKLVKGALKRKIDPFFTAFCLKNLHKDTWKDRHEIDGKLNMDFNLADVLSEARKLETKT